MPHKRYDSRHEWFDHEFRAHLRELIATENRVKDTSTERLKHRLLECPICFSGPQSISELERHIAKHLEEVALFVLPSTFDNEEDELSVQDRDEVSEPVEARDYYGILGVPPSAEYESIQNAFRSLAMKFNPAGETANIATFQAVQQAHDILSDPLKRQAYDLAHGHNESPSAALAYPVDTRMDTEMDTREDVPKSYIDSEPFDYRSIPTASGAYYIPTSIASRVGSRGDVPSRPSQGSEGNSSHNQEYFLPGEGINREVIQHDICRYLGNDATVRPYQHSDGRQGYLIRSYRALTSVSSIQTLKREIKKFTANSRFLGDDHHTQT
jgi:curved DNA-binding protein CbpA